MEELLLRFSFMDGVLSHAKTLLFLRALEKELSAYLGVLETFLDNKIPLSAMLALKNGVLGYTAQLNWTRQAIRAYDRRESR